MKKIVSKLLDPKYLIRRIFMMKIWGILPDKLFLKWHYRLYTGLKLNVENPQLYNEKIEWMKLYDRKDIYTTMVDKYAVREYIKEKLGEEYLIPLLGVWDSADDIDFDALPDRFVLKCNHNSGLGMCICKDKSKLNIEKIRKEAAKGLKQNYYKTSREWPYKNVKRRIIAEQFMEQEGFDALIDYKIFCFDGEPKVIMTIDGGHEDESKVKRRMYDENWNLIGVGLRGKDSVKDAEPKPDKLDDLLNVARILSKDMGHVRVDLYLINNKIYFGELTFFHMSGTEVFKPEKYNRIFGDYLKL